MSKESNREAQQIFQNLNKKQSLNSQKKSRNSAKSPQNNILEVLKQDYKQPEQNPYYLKNENLDKFENFDGKFLRENRAELVIEEESYDLENFTISNSVLEKPPIEINPSRELVYFLENNVIRAIEQPKLREKYIQLIGQPRTSKMIQLSFWFILLTKFPGCLDVDDSDSFIAEIRRKMQKKYVKIYSEIQQPKEDLINLFIYTLGWMSHYLFYKYFAKQRFFFDLRFILDCYHILVFEFNGLYVSDFYVRLNLERIFTVKFLCYETMGKPKKKPVQTRPEKFLGNFKFNDTMDAGTDSLSLGQILNEKFKAKKQLPNKLKNNNDFTERQRQNLIEKTSVQAQQERIFERQKKLLQNLQIENVNDSLEIQQSKQNEQVQNQENFQIDLNNSKSQNNESIGNNSFNQNENAKNESQIQNQNQDYNNSLINQLNSQQQLNQSVQNLQETNKQEKINTIQNESQILKGQQKKQKNYFGNMKLNCMQVSPTIGNILSYDNMSLPFMKQKLIKHVFDQVSDSNSNLLGRLKQFNSVQNEKKEVKVKKEEKLSILDQYNLRYPQKEFYSKHPSLDHLFKDMLEMNYVLNQHGEKMIKLPSSQEVMKNFLTFQKQKEIEAHLEQTKIQQLKLTEQQEKEEILKKEMARNLKGKKVRGFMKNVSSQNRSIGESPVQSNNNLVSNLEEKLQDSFMDSTKYQNFNQSQIYQGQLNQQQQQLQQQQSSVKFPEITNLISQNYQNVVPEMQSRYSKNNNNNNYNTKSSIGLNSLHKRTLINQQTNQSLKMEMNQSQIISLPTQKIAQIQASNQKSQFFTDQLQNPLNYSRENSMFKKSQNASLNQSERNFMQRKNTSQQEIDKADMQKRQQIITKIQEPLKRQDIDQYPMMLKPSKNIGSKNDFVYKDKRSKHKEKYAQIKNFGNTDHNINKLITGIILQKQAGNNNHNNKNNTRKNGKFI